MEELLEQEKIDYELVFVSDGSKDATFAKVLEKLAVMTIPEKKSEEDDEEEDNLLDERFLDYPSVALEQSNATLLQMSAAAFKNLHWILVGKMKRKCRLYSIIVSSCIVISR